MRILQRGRKRRIAELAVLLETLAPAELEMLDDATRVIEHVSALSPSA
jgi:hypothetical protein